MRKQDGEGEMLRKLLFIHKNEAAKQPPKTPLKAYNTNLHTRPQRTENPARRKQVRGRGRVGARKNGREGDAHPRTPSPAPQNSSPTSKHGQAFAANSLWPCTVARGKRRRSRSTSASSAMRCEGVRVSFGEPSLASSPPM